MKKNQDQLEISDITSKWPVIIIELDSGHGRSKALREALLHASIPFIPFAAIDGRSGLPEEYESQVDRKGTMYRLGRSMSDTEYGCALSHLGVYKLICERGFKGAIVLEEDAIITPEFQYIASSDIPESYDFMYFDYAAATIYKKWIFYKRAGQHSEIRRMVFNATYATAYSLSARAADYIVSRSLPVRLPADWPCDLRPLRPVLITPRPVQRPTTYSDSVLEASRNKLRVADKHPEKQNLNKNPKPSFRRIRSIFWERLPNIYRMT